LTNNESSSILFKDFSRQDALVNISAETVAALEKVISGNSIKAGMEVQVSPYCSGPEIVAFFNQFGPNEDYGTGFPSRWRYTQSKINDHNGTDSLVRIIEAAVDPRRFFETGYDVQEAVSYLTKYLQFDGYELRKVGNYYRVRRIEATLVAVTTPFLQSGEPNHEFIEEQLNKCEQKVVKGDYDGAITNARSLLEAVLIEMEKRLSPAPPPYDGNLSKLYKRVQKNLNLDPSQKDISDSLRQILSGLISIVSGLASLRNKMSDSHARTYKPSAHHAVLAVNASRTIVSFLFETYDYQLRANKITPIYN
jgi:hypothetical protein